MELNFLGKAQREFLEVGGYHSGVTVEERFGEIVDKVRYYETLGYPEGLGDRFENYLYNNIFSASTPVLTNFGKPMSKDLPCSCNILTPSDSIDSIYGTVHEMAMLTKLGAGIGVDFDKIAEKGTPIGPQFYSNSKLDWIRACVDVTQKVSQTSRRGYGTPFLSIDDKEYYDFMDVVDKNNPNKNEILVGNTVGIKIPFGFMQRLENGDKTAQRKWLKLLTARESGGNIYISFVENMNKNQSDVYKKLNHIVDATNMCTEATTPSYTDYSFVCVIGALNLNYWDIIKEDPKIIEDAICVLDIMNEEYIRLSSGIKSIARARESAIQKRDVGLGTLGFHSLLQSKSMIFGSLESRRLNIEIYSTIQKHSLIATKHLANTLGAAPMAVKAGLNRRNVSLNMIAPNKSTSFISGATSLGIEPFFSNSFTKRLAKIQYHFNNPHLEKVLESYGKNTFEVWQSILENLGSVRHLDFLDDHNKNVFMTFSEISPKDIIDLASDRQQYIDMGQSLNLMHRPNYTISDLHEIHKYAYNKGLKTLYYYYPQAHASLEKNGEAWDSCISCAD